MVNMSNKIKGSGDTIRSSISFPQGVYTSLEKIAAYKKVSLAWVVREAVETYLDKQNEGETIRRDSQNV